MTALDGLRWITNAAFVALAVVALREWLRRRTPASGWMAATFSTMGAVIVAGFFVTEDPETTAEQMAVRLLLAVLMLFPYLMFRFAAALEPAARRTEIAGLVVAGAAVAWTLGIPEFPGPGEPRSGPIVAYTAYIVFAWVALSITVAVRLWRSGRHEPRIARKRMRLLCAGALALACALVASPAARDDEGAGAVVQAAALASAALFYAAYVPPRLLRVWWRRPEEERLRGAELELLTTTSQNEVADVLLPRAAELVGASRAWLVREGDAPPAAIYTVPMREGVLAVATSRYAPLFGDDELSLLSTLAVMADLAMERNRLLERERRARGEAERVGADLEQFAYAASHDLKEPLRLLSGFSRVLRRRYGDRLDTEGVEILDAIVRSTERMHQLIDDLLELSRVGQAELALQHESLLEPLREALGYLAPAIEEAGASVEVETLPVARFDPQLVALVFQNLVGNALKYTGGRAPAVRVSARRVDGLVEVAVADQGEGIDPRFQDRIFAPFQRLHGSEGPAGTGIGLAIVKKAVELHAGEVWVESAPGEGATFHFTLPAA